MSNLPEIPKLKPPVIDDEGGKLRKARPWDIFNRNIEKVSDEIQKERMAICKECPMFIKLTNQCKECGCFMDAKTRLPDAFCPLQKWDRILLNKNSIEYKKIEG